MSSKVAVEKTGIGITKLISSLRLQQTIYGGISVVLIEILMNAGEILRNVKLIFSRCVGCSKGGSNFSQRVLRQHGTSASGPPAVPN